jgi:hypothetical protein
MPTAARAKQQQQQQHAIPKRPVSARPSSASVYSEGGANGKPARRTSHGRISHGSSTYQDGFLDAERRAKFEERYGGNGRLGRSAKNAVREYMLEEMRMQQQQRVADEI